MITQFEQAPVVTMAELDIYDKAANRFTRPIEFPGRYFKASASVKVDHNNRYTFIKGQCYRLPRANDSHSLIYALIDKYLYNRQRNDYAAPASLALRRAINKIMPGAIHQKDAELQAILSIEETITHTYYGECISDDSDSAEEETFKQLPDATRDKKLKTAKEHRKRAGYTDYKSKMDGKGDKPPIDTINRPVIHRPITFNAHERRQASSDIKLINEQLDAHGRLPRDFLGQLKTQFVVAQYRGIHYTTTGWDIVARRSHRAMDEVGKPQYSSAALIQSGVSTYHELIHRLNQEPGFSGVLEAHGEALEEKLLFMQHSGPVSWNGYVYASLFHLMQNWYSSDYDGLPIKLKAELAKQASLFKPFLFNTGRPLLSTADVPYHALKYAYGTKFYKGHQHERLRPRWRKDGRAERPYSGKVYVSLHPLDDYTEYNPSHITSWFRQGLAKLSNLISSERETSFLGFMRKKRIVIQHKAKYPSFKGAYKERYEVKYGIDKSMYEKLQKGFNDFPPHSDERKSLTLLLGEYLCAYHEVRLIDEAREEAEKNGKILIYRDEDGKFSLKHPATPHTAVKRLHKLVMFERGIFESLSANKSQRTVALTPEQIKAKLMTALPGKGNKEKRESIQLRLFGVKKFFEDGEAVIPVVTLTK